VKAPRRRYGKTSSIRRKTRTKKWPDRRRREGRADEEFEDIDEDEADDDDDDDNETDNLPS